MKKILSNIKLLLVSIFLIINKFSYANNENLISVLEQTGKHNSFIGILENNPLFMSIINNTLPSTIYAPTDEAFGLMPKEFKDKIKNNDIKYTTKIILTHLFGGDNVNNKGSDMVLTLDGSLYYTYDAEDLFVKDIVVQGEFLKTDFYTIIPVNCVMFLQQSSKDKRLDKIIQDKYKFTSCCLQTEEEYKEFIKGL